jgi:predicted O-linked N-acetylglucosamine transferase (SPINDLY family)
MITKLLDFYGQKHKLMQEILMLSRQLSAEPEFDRIEKLLAARQEYMSKVDQLDQQLELIKNKLVAETGVGSWQEVLKHRPEFLKQLEPISTAINQAAREAKELTEKSRISAEKKLNALRLDMKKMQSSKVGMAAYHNKPKQHSGYFLDKKK